MLEIISDRNGRIQRMAKRKQYIVAFTEKQKQILELLKNGSHSPLHLIQRSAILLSLGEGRTPSEIARAMDTERNTAAKWRARWIAAKPEWDRIEQENPRQLRSAIKTTLQDAARPGKPAKFTPEQVAHIIKTACEKPEHFGIPLSHWTPFALAREVIKQQIVPTISPRQVGRFLKRKGFETASKPVLAESEHHG